MEKFADLFRKARLEAGKTMGQLARELGVSVAFVSDVELGRRPPFSQERISKAAAFMGVDAMPLLISAASSRGSFELQIGTESTSLQREVAASLARGWLELSHEQLHALKDVVDRKDPKKR